ncbi:hypothetical protein PIB30_048293 [Stylosanthes scabra]|uniref:Uncharacterized protein n=1 Tax=Stylosanthes scabra TaxID=79078 RepID=A0ABU6VFB7_9FABA|nr:hypothetical protein [Stylosanthes scabra]
MDEDEEEDYLVTDDVGDDNEASQSAAGPSTPTEAGTRYDLRTENSRRSPNRFTPSGWSTKNLKKGASRIYKNGVKYGCLAVEGDDDLQILFHCRRQFPEVRTTELFVEIAESLASSGGSAPIPRPVNVGEASGSRNQRVLSPVASPSFDFNLQAEMATGANEVGDSHPFGELGVPVAATPQPVSPPVFEGVPVPDPQVAEPLRSDDSDAEPEFIEGESDDEAGPVPYA